MAAGVAVGLLDIVFQLTVANSSKTAIFAQLSFYYFLLFLYLRRIFRATISNHVLKKSVRRLSVSNETI
jgi:hypothetical protein